MGQNFSKLPQKWAKASELWGPVFSLFDKDFFSSLRLYGTSTNNDSWCQNLRDKYLPPHPPQNRRHFGSHVLKQKNTTTNQPQNLPSLINKFFSKSKDGGDLPKIPAASSNTWRGQVSIFTKPSKHHLLYLLLWLIFCVSNLPTEN